MGFLKFRDVFPGEVLPLVALPLVAMPLAILSVQCSAPAESSPVDSAGATGGALPGTGATGAGAGAMGAQPSVGGTGGTMTTGGTGPGIGGTGGGTSTTFWPNSATAAVTLTYDDGLDGQLKYAVPALDARGLKGTFFLSSFQGVDHNWSLPNLTDNLTVRHQAWVAVASSGHELAGHTIYHPCDNNNPGWKPADYTMESMGAELDESLQRLGRLGATAPFTFAYPCSGDVVGIAGGTSYAPLVAQRFLSARVSMSGIADPMTVDLQAVPQRESDEATTGATLIAAVDEAIASGGWLVVLFHGVGPAQECDINQFNLDACALNYLSTSEATHTALLDYLASKPEVWTATMKDVAQHIQTSRP